MSFPTRLLAPGEEVYLDARPNWSYLFWPSVITVIVLAGCVAVVVLWGSAPIWVGWILLAAALGALVYLASRYIGWRTKSFVVTSQRIVYRTGAVRRTGREIPIGRVQDVTYHQTIVERVVRAAGLQGDVEQFPKGLDTVVGERGITLSGGQKQRLALARALLTEAPILILDDAFSSVDTETEARILSGLKDAAAGRTVFLVSHRLSTLRNADLIVVLENGRVAETGTHDELLARGGVYAELAERQRLAEEVEAA
jgi:membrane protein YdbS with pleckstrin-like domain